MIHELRSFYSSPRSQKTRVAKVGIVAAKVSILKQYMHRHLIIHRRSILLSQSIFLANISASRLLYAVPGLRERSTFLIHIADEGTLHATNIGRLWRTCD